jgi:Fe-S cluster biogenesis protein NfuA
MESESVEARIESALSQVRPYLQADGGDVQLLRFKADSGRLELKWVGTCAICPLSILTLRAGVERTVMHVVPEVKRVEAVAE